MLDFIESRMTNFAEVYAYTRKTKEGRTTGDPPILRPLRLSDTARSTCPEPTRQDRGNPRARLTPSSRQSWKAFSS
jgi:hypothetical protein